MKGIVRALLVGLTAASILAGCIVAPAPPYETEAVPALPPVVVLGPEPFYFYNGYHYYYHDDRWHYARQRNGPWRELPRSHWPRETRFRGRGGEFRGHEMH